MACTDFDSKSSKNRLVLVFCPDPLEELTALPRSPTGKVREKGDTAYWRIKVREEATPSATISQIGL